MSDGETFAEATEILTASDERASIIRRLQKELQDEREEVERLRAKIGRHRKELDRTIPFQSHEPSVPETLRENAPSKFNRDQSVVVTQNSVLPWSSSDENEFFGERSKKVSREAVREVSTAGSCRLPA